MQILVRDMLYKKDSGFTLIEMLVVILIVGILSAIAVPSWLAFVNRQQISKATDVVYAKLQEANREAKNKKLSYSVSVRKNPSTQDAEIAIYPTKKADGTNLSFNEIMTWEPIGKEVNTDSKKIILGANLDGENIASTVSNTLKTAGKVTFDYMGTLPNANFGTTEPAGLKIVLTASSTKRCVIVRTLIGSLYKGKDFECN